MKPMSNDDVREEISKLHSRVNAMLHDYNNKVVTELQ